MTDLNLEEIRDTMVAVAFEAGRMILAANPSDTPPDTKLNSADIVTETDKAVEQLVSASLSRAHPGIAFVGEETWHPGLRVGEEPTFVVDPIDGTTNFVHGFPHACVSLGLAVRRRPVVGVVYNPFLDTLYTAVEGKGAYVTVGRSWGVVSSGSGEDGGQKLGRTTRLPLAREPAPLAGLVSALVATEVGSQRDGPNYALKMDVLRRLCASSSGGPDGGGGAMAQGVRSLGSAALNLCGVAAGQLDAYWEGGCWAWDVCAGWCVLREAGGLMAGGNPGAWDPEIDDRKYLAVRASPGGRGQRELVEEFWAVMGGREMVYES